MLLPESSTWFSLQFQPFDYSVDCCTHFITFRKACLNAFILVVSCFITCSSQDHVISPRMSLIGVNPQTGIILRVRREKGLRLVF